MVTVEANRSNLNGIMSAWRVATDARFAAIHARFDAVGKRFDAVDRRFDDIDRRLDGIDVRLERIEHRMTDLVAWWLLCWISSIGLFAFLLRLMR